MMCSRPFGGVRREEQSNKKDCGGEHNKGSDPFVGCTNVRLTEGVEGIAPIENYYFFVVLSITFYGAYIEIYATDFIEKPLTNLNKLGNNKLTYNGSNKLTPK